MSVGVFTDRARPPTDGELTAALGPRRADWDQLVEFLSTRYGGSSEFRFYGKNYGWALRFYKGCHSLASVFPAQESLTTLIVLRPGDVDQALLLDLNVNARQALEEANPYPEGRWLFIPMHSEKDFEDIRSLLAVKFPARRRAKTATPPAPQS